MPNPTRKTILGIILVVCAVGLGLLTFRAYVKTSFFIVDSQGKGHRVTAEYMLKRVEPLRNSYGGEKLYNLTKMDVDKKRRKVYTFGLLTLACAIPGAILLSASRRKKKNR